MATTTTTTVPDTTVLDARFNNPLAKVRGITHATVATLTFTVAGSERTVVVPVPVGAIVNEKTGEYYLSIPGSATLDGADNTVITNSDENAAQVAENMRPYGTVSERSATVDAASLALLGITVAVKAPRIDKEAGQFLGIFTASGERNPVAAIQNRYETYAELLKTHGMRANKLVALDAPREVPAWFAQWAPEATVGAEVKGKGKN